MRSEDNMKIEILGTGCRRCDQLYENSLTAAAEFEDKFVIEVRKIGDIKYFTQKGVFMTPGLLIDGDVISVGKLLSSDDIKRKIEERL